jgi:hypothetical protein
MPIYYASIDEAQAKSMCASAGGSYLGAPEDVTDRFMWQTHVGLCVNSCSAHRDGEWDQLMVVYDPATDSFNQLHSGTTAPFSGTYAVGACVDAPRDIQAKYFRHLCEKELREERERERQIETRRKAQFARLNGYKGKMFKVIHGSEVPKGTVGKCFWAGPGKKGPRIGIKATDGRVYWTSPENVRQYVAQPRIFAPAVLKSA